MTRSEIIKTNAALLKSLTQKCNGFHKKGFEFSFSIFLFGAVANFDTWADIFDITTVVVDYGAKHVKYHFEDLDKFCLCFCF